MQQRMTILETSIFDVFEKMFFLYLEPAESTDANACLKASIEFGKPGEGKISLYFSEPFLMSMARNMLSSEAQELTDGDREDCAREATNMVCGNFLAMLDPSRRYDLTIPRCEGVGALSTSEAESGERLDYTIDDAPWAMAVILSGDVLKEEASG